MRGSLSFRAPVRDRGAAAGVGARPRECAQAGAHPGGRLQPRTAAAPADRRRHAPEPAGAGSFGHLRTDRAPDRALGAFDGLLGLPMDASGAGRLNRSSPSCLNRSAQRIDFFHGLIMLPLCLLPCGDRGAEDGVFRERGSRWGPQADGTARLRRMFLVVTKAGRLVAGRPPSTPCPRLWMTVAGSARVRGRRSGGTRRREGRTLRPDRGRAIISRRRGSSSPPVETSRRTGLGRFRVNDRGPRNGAVAGVGAQAPARRRGASRPPVVCPRNNLAIARMWPNGSSNGDSGPNRRNAPEINRQLVQETHH